MTRELYSHKLFIIIIKRGRRLGTPKTPAPEYQPIDRKKRNGKIVEDYIRATASVTNKKALGLLLKPASPTRSNTRLARSFQRE